MSVILCCRMSWTAAALVMLLLAYQSSPLHAQEQAASSVAVMERVRLSEDGTEFVMAKSGTTFAPWGFNFVGEFGRIVEELDEFIEGAGARVDGWISHYFGNSIEEHATGAKPSGKLTAKFFEYWKDKGVTIQAREE